ncbi:MAG: thioredoxin family protein [Gammaproteobacteria bacterium]|nr:thioredoxin family protein [Gammaproteobacteria bacterium]
MSKKKQRKKSRKHAGKNDLTSKNLAEISNNDNPTKKQSAGTVNKKIRGQNTFIMTRRNAIRLLIALPVTGAVGAAIHRYDVQNKGLHDLTLVGQGTPVVVQIHDPQCQKCRRLMNNTRKALKDHEDIVFRVADISSGDGSQFQKKHNANTVSLLLFNAVGKRVDTIEGVASVDELKSRFASLN